MLLDEDEYLDRDNDNALDYDTTSVAEAIGRMTRAVLEVPEEVEEEVRELPDFIITEDSLEFVIKMSERPEFFNVYYVCEAASRVLFETVRWARSIQVVNNFFI